MTNQKTKGLRWFPILTALIVIGLVGLPLIGFALMKLSGADAASPDLVPKLTHKISRGDLLVSVIEQGVLESSENTEIKCKVRGNNTVIWVIENGSQVKKGDVLVRLDTLAIEDAINERSKYAHWSRSGAEQSSANVARTKLAISQYKNGSYVSQLLTLEKELSIAEANLLMAKNSLSHAEKLQDRGFVHSLEVQQKTELVNQAELDVDVKKTDIDVLKRFSKAMQLETLNGDLKSAEATHAANVERAELDETRRDQALEEFEQCVIKAEKDGLVIFPSAAAWKATPDVAEGATVYKDQVLLLMPELLKMQVKVGVHEAIVDRIDEGLETRIKLPDLTLEGAVSEVATVARPAGWWTGNVVKYDTIVKLPSIEGLKPGMSAEVEIIIANHKNVLKIPVSAVLETQTETLCWIMVEGSAQRRSIKIGDSNDVFIVVEEGLNEGDEVILNPVAYIREAQIEAQKTLDRSTDSDANSSAEDSIKKESAQKASVKSGSGSEQK